MTKQKIKDTIKECMETRNLCRVYFKYDPNYWYLFPLIMDDSLFLSAEEDDFILDGYTIRRFRDISKAEIKFDKCIEILRKEGVVGSIVMPNINISNWESAFFDLKRLNKYVIVEKEDLDDENTEFVIGKIEKIYKTCVYIRHFDADGIWQDESWRIPYAEITSVTFDSRYVNMFSKYLEQPEF